MSNKPSTHPATPIRTEILRLILAFLVVEEVLPNGRLTRSQTRRLTLALPPLLFFMGLFFSLIIGFSAPQAMLKATEFTLAGLAGWVVFFLIRRPTDLWNHLYYVVIANASMLNPTIRPRPFPRMLAESLIISVILMSLVALLDRLLRGGGKSAPPSSAHPLSDAEIDQPPSRP